MVSRLTSLPKILDSSPRVTGWKYPTAISTIASNSESAAAPPLVGADEARIVSEKQIKPRVIELTIATPAFTGPTKVHVDLPTGYDADPKRRWPVTYVLAGTIR